MATKLLKCSLAVLLDMALRTLLDPIRILNQNIINIKNELCGGEREGGLPGPGLGRRRRKNTMETVVPPVGSGGQARLRLCHRVEENVFVRRALALTLVLALNRLGLLPRSTAGALVTGPADTEDQYQDIRISTTKHKQRGKLVAQYR